MAILDDLTKGPVPLLLGLGIAVAAPAVIPALAGSLRPLAKVLVSGGITLFAAAKEGGGEAGEQISDLIAETRAEMAHSAKHETDGSPAEYVEATGRSRRRRSRS